MTFSPPTSLVFPFHFHFDSNSDFDSFCNASRDDKHKSNLCMKIMMIISADTDRYDARYYAGQLGEDSKSISKSGVSEQAKCGTIYD